MTDHNTGAGVSARLKIDLAALDANYRMLAGVAAPSVCGAVVKANAYGLGVKPVVERLVRSGCRAFFVASLDEGLEVRGSAPEASIYVFAGADQATSAELAAARLIPLLNAPFQLDAWRGRPEPAAIHVDTGMGRLGFAWERLAAEQLDDIEVALLATHLACADDPDHPVNALQIQRFAQVAQRFPGVATSIGNSAGTLHGAPTRGDLCRPGIALYGGDPFLDHRQPMQPVVTLEARILQILELEAGASVGYGATHVMDRPGRVATLGVGYADGVPRRLSNRGAVQVAGVRAPIIGRISMDLMSVDVTDVAPSAKDGAAAQVGDWVEILGPGIGIDEFAGWADTIGYEVLTGLGPRAVRVYVD